MVVPAIILWTNRPVDPKVVHRRSSQQFSAAPTLALSAGGKAGEPRKGRAGPAFGVRRLSILGGVHGWVSTGCTKTGTFLSGWVRQPSGRRRRTCSTTGLKGE